MNSILERVIKVAGSLATLAGCLVTQRLMVLASVTHYTSSSTTDVMFDGVDIETWLALRLENSLRRCYWVCYTAIRVGKSRSTTSG